MGIFVGELLVSGRVPHLGVFMPILVFDLKGEIAVADYVAVISLSWANSYEHGYPKWCFLKGISLPQICYFGYLSSTSGGICTGNADPRIHLKIYTGWCSTPNQLLICSSFSRENGHPLLICSSLSTAQYIYIYVSIHTHPPCLNEAISMYKDPWKHKTKHPLSKHVPKKRH